MSAANAACFVVRQPGLAKKRWKMERPESRAVSKALARPSFVSRSRVAIVSATALNSTSSRIARRSAASVTPRREAAARPVASRLPSATVAAAPPAPFHSASSIFSRLTTSTTERPLFQDWVRSEECLSSIASRRSRQSNSEQPTR